jgi:hypothetical protein
MAEFVVTNGSSHYIEKIVIEAKQKLVLVTPYLNLSDNFLKRLYDADRRGVQIIIVYGKDQLKGVEREKLKNLVNLEIYFCQNLHAKCYHNEESLLLTSMNLYEFSEKNNREMGVFFTCRKDRKIFDATLAEIDSIIAFSNKEQNERYILSEEYSSVYNFHLPTLLQRVKLIFPKLDWQISKSEIIVNDFPSPGMDFSISNRLMFNIGRYRSEDTFKEQMKQVASNSEARIFFNHTTITVYPPSNFKFNQIAIEDLKEKSEYFLKIFNDFTSPQVVNSIKNLYLLP